MALLIDALNKADRERQENIAWSLDNDSPASPKKEPQAQPSTPPPFPTFPNPRRTSSFNGAWILLVLLVLSIAMAALYWAFTPTSGLQLLTNLVSKKPNTTPVAVNTVPPEKSKPVPVLTEVPSKPLEAQEPPPQMLDQREENIESEQNKKLFTASKFQRTKTPTIKPREAKRSTINKNSGAKTLTIKKKVESSPLAMALTLMNQQNYEAAQGAYQKILRVDPHNIEALQNMGVIAYNIERFDEAKKYWQKVLQHKPEHSFAREALSAISTDNANISVEATSKSSMKRASPSSKAHKYFLQGVQLADQNLWVEAQNQFFLAWSAQSDHPDYAYNLAVSLDQLGEEQLAVQYYRLAIDNAEKIGTQKPHFPLAVARERIKGFAQ